MARGENHGRFIWHELLTNDTAAATEFYHEVVGWSTQPSNVPGMKYTLWTGNGVPVGGLMETPLDAPDMPPAWLGYVEVDDVSETTATAEKLGGRIVAPMHTVEGVGTFAILSDPQGAVFGVIKSARPLEPETDPKPFEFSWHELMTTDWKAASEFYGELFGWVKQSEFDMGPMGTYYMFGRDRFTYGGMMNKPADVPAPTHWLYYALVRDTADAAAERATARGGTIVAGPMEVPGGDRVAAMIDPQGAGFAVHSKAPVAATV